MQDRLYRPSFLHLLSPLAGLEELSDTQFITPLLSIRNFESLEEVKWLGWTKFSLPTSLTSTSPSAPLLA